MNNHWLTQLRDVATPPLSPVIVDPPNHEADGKSTATEEATEEHLANLIAEIRLHSQYFNESRNNFEWIAWVQEALGNEWSEHLAKMENFERDRVVRQKRKEEEEKRRLEECRMGVVRRWMKKQEQGWEGDRKRWAEDDCSEREEREGQRKRTTAPARRR